MVKKKTIDMQEKQEEPYTADTVKQTTIGSEDMIWGKIMHQHMHQNKTMREIADEIGLSPATLSRFCNKKMKRISKSVNEKLNKWYERQMIIESM
jgi:DNA-binding Xre family transcriptional regulator